jgi:hypothetical protein
VDILSHPTLVTKFVRTDPTSKIPPLEPNWVEIWGSLDVRRGPTPTTWHHPKVFSLPQLKNSPPYIHASQMGRDRMGGSVPASMLVDQCGIHMARRLRSLLWPLPALKQRRSTSLSIKLINHRCEALKHHITTSHVPNPPTSTIGRRNGQVRRVQVVPSMLLQIRGELRIAPPPMISGPLRVHGSITHQAGVGLLIQ